MMIETGEAEGAAVGLKNQWLPFTPNRDFKDNPRIFERAGGKYYYGPDGRAILDGSSGLYTTPAGHARPEIADAVYRQIQTLDYTSSFLRSHPGSFAVCEALLPLLPERLDHIFMTNSGSEAVDTAVKMALHYQRVRRQASRTMFVSRERAYHGSNLTGVALGGIPSNRRDFGIPMLPVVHMRHTWLEENRLQPGQGEHGAYLADDLLRLIQLHGAENVAACIVEPIAGSTGTLVPPIGYLARLREICDEHGVLLIFDEVICGFGRTGSNFASQAFGVTPDILVMAKAITNGVIPMGAVAVHRRIYETVVEADPKRTVEFFHGYTGSAHPVACAACIATLGIYQRDDLFGEAQALSPYFLDRLFQMAGKRGILDVRGYGMLGGIDLDPAVIGTDGYGFQKRLYDRGVHIKSTGNSLIVSPPFILNRDDVDCIVSAIEETLES